MVELHDGSSSRDAVYNMTAANHTRTNFLFVRYVNTSQTAAASLYFNLTFNTTGMCVCVRVYVRVCACVCACVCVGA